MYLDFKIGIKNNAPISRGFLEKGIQNFDEAKRWVHRLSYGRNSNCFDYSLVFKEEKGTCTTKHTLLAALAIENFIPVSLKVGICRLDLVSEPHIAVLLDQLNIEWFPEAHCYCLDKRKPQEEYFDVTFPGALSELSLEVVKEYDIIPEDIRKKKQQFHLDYLKAWIEDTGVGNRFTIEEVYAIREKWIKSLGS